VEGTWRVLGLMSGSSLDGLDMCLAQFTLKEKNWQFKIEKAVTQPYPKSLIHQLGGAHLASLTQLQELDVALGGFFVQAAQAFLVDVAMPDLLSTHGHTVLHQPARGYTLQIGGAHALAAQLSLPVAYDFRSADVALRGQGAPLVPMGDALLFGQYAACLNLGGIANISFMQNDRHVAFDLAYCNMVLNYLSNQIGAEYDAGGLFAASGKPIPDLLSQLDAWDFYSQDGPKSLGREQFESVIRPILDHSPNSIEDKLHTFTMHLAKQLAASINGLSRQGEVLVTGGGAFNSFLVEALQSRCQLKIVVPNSMIVSQKEALIFGFLGLLRYLRLPNVYSSVTGSRTDHCAGSLIELFP
jgi:anhydro-N-acetylmuramic acid kinase